MTFTSTGKDPELVLAEPQPTGPPKLVLNPEIFAPVGGTTYSGKGYLNSGFIWGTKAPFPGPRTYSLAFDTPGTYQYFCVMHDQMGMQGQITVQPKEMPPSQSPATGGATRAGVIQWLLLLGLGLVATGSLLILKLSKIRQ